MLLSLWVLINLAFTRQHPDRTRFNSLATYCDVFLWAFL
jgi:hypothetical protein